MNFMATVILEVPSDKIKAFVNMILDLGIEKNRIIPTIKERAITVPQKNWFNNFNSKQNFSWDMNRNELEFE